MWDQVLRFARTFEVFLYLVLSLGGIFFIRRFARAWQELQGAAFGLEREGAQTRLNTAASALVVLLTMAVILFVLVSFVAPVYLGSMPLPTPTLNLLATATITFPAALPQSNPTPGGTPAATNAPVFLEAPSGGCIPGQVAISIPKDGDEVAGIVSIIGTADIPNFGFYKGVYKRPDEAGWTVISAGNQVRHDDRLMEWDTTRLAPGVYQLGIVMTDNKSKTFNPCVIQVRVARPTETPPGQ